ncbi:MAG: Mov34/MPN/PAD-1 family protein [Trebonia sp.]
MLIIPKDLYDKVVAHARADHPDEACGVLAGVPGRQARLAARAVRTPGHSRHSSLSVLPGRTAVTPCDMTSAAVGSVSLARP